MIRGFLTARLRRVNRIGADALAGRRGVSGMIFGYSALAAVLLVYVSMQVYTGSLRENIEEKRRKQEKLQEMIGMETMRRAELSSRHNVIRFCEDRLDMERAGSEDVSRVALEHYDEPVQYTLEEPVRVRELLRQKHDELSEVGQK